jgi:hypothetical protein
VAGAAIENIAEEAEDFGTTPTELATEIQEEVGPYQGRDSSTSRLNLHRYGP